MSDHTCLQIQKWGNRFFICVAVIMAIHQAYEEYQAYIEYYQVIQTCE